MPQNRIWQIEEQIFVDPNTQYTFQFGSVHSEEVAAGNLPPDHDREIFMKMWAPDGQKCLTMTFDRNGYRVRAELTDKADPPPVQPGQEVGQMPEGYPSSTDQFKPAGLEESPGV